MIRACELCYKVFIYFFSNRSIANDNQKIASYLGSSVVGANVVVVVSQSVVVVVGGLVDVVNLGTISGGMVIRGGGGGSVHGIIIGGLFVELDEILTLHIIASYFMSSITNTPGPSFGIIANFIFFLYNLGEDGYLL